MNSSKNKNMDRHFLKSFINLMKEIENQREREKKTLFSKRKTKTEERKAYTFVYLTSNKNFILPPKAH